MKYKGKSNEYLLLTTVTNTDNALLKEPLENGLTVLWNIDREALLVIDGVQFRIQKNQIIFLTEFHQTEIKNIQQLRLIRFNRSFYCIIDHDSEVGCKGILFFGASQVPLISIPVDESEKFETLWKMFGIEMQSKDSLQIEMLQMMLKRFLILCTRLYKIQHKVLTMGKGSMDIVRQFNFLVESFFKTKHTVAEYAGLLNKSPKTLSNLFAQYNQKTPLQIIQDRKLLEARRLLHYTDKSVKEIAYELGFEDVQTFSRFFKKKEGVSPKQYKLKT